MIQNRPEAEGGKVRYVPWQAKGDESHADCQDGVITSWNELYVFVRYDKNTGDTSQATDRENLVWL